MRPDGDQAINYGRRSMKRKERGKWIQAINVAVMKKTMKQYDFNVNFLNLKFRCALLRLIIVPPVVYLTILELRQVLLRILRLHYTPALCASN